MDEMAEKQRLREQEIEERRRASEGLARPSDGSRTSVAAVAAPAAAAAAVATAPTPGKYVPKFRRGGGEAPPPAEPQPSNDRWRNDRRPFGGTAPRWSSSRIPQRGG